MNILFIGDVIGKPGRQCVTQWLPEMCEELSLDFVIANAENSAGGLGATPETLEDMRRAGVHAFTMGNHTWRKKILVTELDTMCDVVRPANYSPGAPGRGHAVVRGPRGNTVGLVSVLGRVYLDPNECPFDHALKAAEELRKTTPIVLVDIHAEATSEKVAMGWHLDGRCTAVVGTHTHVQTADDRVLPEGTAYITDVGMTGPRDSVIGSDRDAVLKRFVTGMPSHFSVATEPPWLNAVLIDADDETGQARSITRIQRMDN
jgi:metallophosphoesterase (TIGR00282 family)